MKKSTIIKIVSGVAIGAAATAVIVKYLPIIRNKIDDFLDSDEDCYDFEEEEYKDECCDDIEEDIVVSSKEDVNVINNTITSEKVEDEDVKIGVIDDKEV